MQSNKLFRHQGGFTLVELAIVLSIVALLLGGLAVPLGTRIAQQQYTDTQARLDRAVDALVGFAVLNRRLPCPDMFTSGNHVDDRDGAEDTVPALSASAGVITGCNTGTATFNSDSAGASWGDLPYATLGLSGLDAADAWGNRFRYVVYTPLAVQSGAAPIGFSALGTTPPMLSVLCHALAQPANTYPPNCTLAAPTIANNAVFVVYSHGANGFGATSLSGLNNLPPPPSGNVDESQNFPNLELGAANAGNRSIYIQRIRTDANSTSGEFDDLLIFMSANTLAAKLLAAGVWP